jgi:hypothetical protein
LSPEELAAAHERALRWREEWRDDVAGREGGMNGYPALPPALRPPVQDGKPSAQFATAIARAEFGRFYWSGPAAGPARKTGGKAKRR